MNEKNEETEKLLEEAVEEAKQLGIDTKNFEENEEDKKLKKKYKDAEDKLKKKYEEKKKELQKKVGEVKEEKQQQAINELGEELMYEDKKGDLVEGQTLIKRVDIELNNKLLERHNKILKFGVIAGGILGVWSLSILTYMVVKIVITGAVNTYIAHCA